VRRTTPCPVATAGTRRPPTADLPVRGLPSPFDEQGVSVAGITRRDLLRSAGLVALLAACGTRTPAGEPEPDAAARPEPPEPAAEPPTEIEPPPDPVEDPPEESEDEQPPAERRRVEVVCRDAWDAEAARPTAVAHTITGLMLHHSAVVLDDDRDGPERMRLHQRHHHGQGWADIAYHLGVDRQGNVYELRDLRTSGETGTPYDPAGWLLVMAEGNYDVQDPTEEQLDAIAAVFAWGAAAFDVAPASISTHRHHVPTTACPGDSLYAEVAEGRLAARVAEVLAAGGVQLVSVCGQEGRERVATIEAGA
jgi:hypothetical protein